MPFFKVKINENVDFALKIRKSNLFFAKSGVPDSIVFSAQNDFSEYRYRVKYFNS